MYAYIGEIYVQNVGLFPCAIPLHQNLRQRLDYSTAKKLGMELSSKCKPVFAVHDGASVYHAVFSELPTTEGVIPISEVVSSLAKKFSSVCELLKTTGVVRLVKIEYSSKPTEKYYAVLPLITVYENGVWEHVSLTPMRDIETAEYYLYEKLNVGVVLVRKPADEYRPNMLSILRNPSSNIIARNCNIKVEEVLDRKAGVRW